MAGARSRVSQGAVRLLALWVPDWPVVSLSCQGALLGGSGPGTVDPAVRPVAVSGGAGVLAASAPARAAGVRLGMRLRLARSLCPGLVVLPSSPEREMRAFEPVVEAVGELVAEPAVARPGLVLAEARGPARWSGGEERLAVRVIEAVTESTGVEGQVGVADSLLGAVLAARKGVLVPAGKVQDFLSPWPVASLLAALTAQRARQEAQVLIETFSRLGLRRLGDLAALPGRDVSARFGPTGAVLHALASGQESRAPSLRRPESDVQVERDLDPPVERTDQAAFAARVLAESLCGLLLRRGLAAGRLRVQVRCVDGTERSRSWVLEALPAPADVTDRVRWQLEGWLCGTAGAPGSPLVHLSLTALELWAAGAEQRGLWLQPGAHGRQRITRAAARVESLLGAGAVLQPVLEEGWDPRSRVRLRPWGEEVLKERPGPRSVGLPPPWRGALPAPSPTLVPATPVPVRLEGASGQDVEVGAQGALGCDPHVLRVEEGPWSGVWTVKAWGGPWPVADGWWRPGGESRRAYLQVVTREGRTLLLVRQGRWWIDGAYD